MLTVFDQLFSGFGLVLFFLIATVLATIGVLMYVDISGIRKLKSPTSSQSTILQRRTSSLIITVVLGIVLMSWVLLMSWGEISSGIVFVGDFYWNILFVVFVAALMGGLLAFFFAAFRDVRS